MASQMCYDETLIHRTMRAANVAEVFAIRAAGIIRHLCNTRNNLRRVVGLDVPAGWPMRGRIIVKTSDGKRHAIYLDQNSWRWRACPA